MQEANNLQSQPADTENNLIKSLIQVNYWSGTLIKNILNPFKGSKLSSISKIFDIKKNIVYAFCFQKKSAGLLLQILKY